MCDLSNNFKLSFFCKLFFLHKLLHNFVQNKKYVQNNRIYYHKSLYLIYLDIRDHKKLIPKDASCQAAKFLPLVSHFLRENYTVFDARRCRYRQCFTENCQKVGETRVDSKERSPSRSRWDNRE